MTDMLEEGKNDGPEPTGSAYHAVDGQELIASLQATVPLGHAPRDDAGDVNGRVLLLAAHHIEAQALLCLGQLHHPWVRVAFAGRKGCNCGLGGTENSLFNKGSFYHFIAFPGFETITKNNYLNFKNKKN